MRLIYSILHIPPPFPPPEGDIKRLACIVLYFAFSAVSPVPRKSKGKGLCGKRNFNTISYI